MGTSLCRDPKGEAGGDFCFPGISRDTVKEGSGNGSSLCMGALQGEPGGMASLPGVMKKGFRKGCSSP